MKCRLPVGASGAGGDGRLRVVAAEWEPDGGDDVTY